MSNCNCYHANQLLAFEFFVVRSVSLRKIVNETSLALKKNSLFNYMRSSRMNCTRRAKDTDSEAVLVFFHLLPCEGSACDQVHGCSLGNAIGRLIVYSIFFFIYFISFALSLSVDCRGSQMLRVQCHRLPRKKRRHYAMPTLFTILFLIS